MWIGYEDTDRKISYPYAYNLSVNAQAIRVCAEEGDNDEGVSPFVYGD